MAVLNVKIRLDVNGKNVNIPFDRARKGYFIEFLVKYLDINSNTAHEILRECRTLTFKNDNGD